MIIDQSCLIQTIWSRFKC